MKLWVWSENQAPGNLLPVIRFCNFALPSAEISHGTIEWTGDDLLKKSEPNMAQIRGKEISMIFQDPMSCLNPYLTALEQVAEPPIIHNLVTPTEAMQQA